LWTQKKGVKNILQIQLKKGSKDPDLRPDPPTHRHRGVADPKKKPGRTPACCGSPTGPPAGPLGGMMGEPGTKKYRGRRVNFVGDFFAIPHSPPPPSRGCQLTTSGGRGPLRSSGAVTLAGRNPLTASQGGIYMAVHVTTSVGHDNFPSALTAPRG